jgi:putative nucleotidyltransferase with HDIG domain
MIINQFKEYTQSYLNKVDENVKPKIQLKINHSLEVMNIAERIGRSIFDIKNTTFVKICGLYHDIGRFEQFYKYNTYWDKDSIDHGELGSKIINDFKFDITHDEFEILRLSILYHNKYEIPLFDDKTQLFINITRDSDKVDIYRVVMKYHTEELKVIDDDISDKVFNSIMKEQVVNYDDVQTKMDNYILMLSWVYDINYSITFDIIKEQGHLKELFHKLPYTDRLKKLKDKIYYYM